MSKATRIRQQNAREKIAAQRAAERRAEQRRRMFITGGSVLAVIVIVVAFIVVKSMNSPTTTPSSAARTPLPASVTNEHHQRAGQRPGERGQGLGPHVQSGTDHHGHRPGADEQRQARDAVHRRRILPLLRRDAMVHGGGPEPVRHAVDAAARHPLVQQRRLPGHGHADLLQDRLQQQVPGLHPGRERTRSTVPRCRAPPRSRTRSGPGTSQTPASAATRSSASGTSTCSRRRSTTRPC